MAKSTKTLAAAVKRADKWRERYNPLRGLTAETARALIESYLSGQATDLMWAQAAPMIGIEACDPDYLALIERTTARLLEMDWDIRTAADAKGAAGRKAKRQAEVLRAGYDRFDDLYQAIGHLAMARFRGWAHVEVDWGKGELLPIPPWHVLRDGLDGGWGYNPSARTLAYESLDAEYRIDPERHWWLIRTHDRPIAGWALLKYFYQALAARDWAAFTNIYGIPGGVVVGPPTIPAGQEDLFEQAAADIARGGEGYLPHGSEWKPNVAARGTQPFKEWLDWLSGKLILAGTGGKLTMLNDATGLGSGQSQSHEETFDQIAKAEARKIGEVLNRQFDRRLLEAEGLIGPGERPLAWWALSSGEETDSASIIDEVGKLALAGYKVDLKQVEEKTGYQLMPNGDVRMANRRTFNVQRSTSDVQREYKGASMERLLQGKRRDLQPLMDAVAALEDAPDPSAYAAALEDLRARLAELLPDVTESEYARALEAVLGGALASGAVGVLERGNR